jgi:outer membrane protein
MIMRHAHLLIAILLCLLLPSGLPAQDPAPPALSAPAPLALTLEDAVSMAQRSNLGLRAERLKLEEARKADSSSWNAFLPQISLTAAMSRSNLGDADRMQPDLTMLPAYVASGFTGSFPTVTIPRWGAQLLLDVSWSLSAAQFLSVKQTALEYNRGLISEQIAEKRLARQVKQLYYSLLLSRESVQIFEQNLDLAKRRLDLARARESVGAASALDVLAEEVNQESIRPQIIEQQNTYDVALANLKQVLGVAQDIPVSLSSTLDVPTEGGGDSAGKLQQARTRLDLSYLRAVIDSLRNKLALDRSGLTPSLFVKWTFDPTFQRDPTDPSTWSGVGFFDLWKQSQGALTIGVSVPLDPLLPSSRVRTDMARSELQIQEATLGYQSALEGAEIEVLTLLRQIDKSVELIAVAEKNIALAQRLYDAAEKAYASGGRNYLELQDAQNKLDRARFERLRDKHDYLASLAELEFALTGGDFISKE